MSQIIYEAFKALQDLKEDTFSFDKQGTTDLYDFLHAENTDSDTIKVVDPEADSADELKDSYDGDVVLCCCVCNCYLSKNSSEVKIDETTHRANVDEECPYCLNKGGFKIVSQIGSGETSESEDMGEEETVADPSVTSESPEIEEVISETGEEEIKESITPEGEQKEERQEDSVDEEELVNKIKEFVFKAYIGKDDNGTHYPYRFAKWFKEDALEDFSISEIALLAVNAGYPVKKVKFGWEGDDDYVIGDIKQAQKDLEEECKDNNTPVIDIITGEEIKGKQIKESMEEADLVLEEDDLISFDEESGDIVVDSQVFDDFVPNGYIRIKFVADNSETIQEYKMVKETEDGIRMEWMGTVNESDEINESKKGRKKSLWDIIYGELTEDGTQYIASDTNKPRINKGAGYNYGDQISVDVDGNIVVRGEKEEDLRGAIKIAEKHDENGVTYTLRKTKAKKYPVWLIISVPEEEKYDHELPVMEDFSGADVILEDSDIISYDEEDNTLTVKPGIENGVGEELVIKFKDHGKERVCRVKISEKALDGTTLLKIQDADLSESIKSITVQTDSDNIVVKPEGDSELTLHTNTSPIDESGEIPSEPAAVDEEEAVEISENPELDQDNPPEESSDVLEPVSPETKAQIESNAGEDGVEEEEVEEEVSDIEEKNIDELGEAYLKEVYGNVASYKTVRGYVNDSTIMIEGIITFNSGKKAKTNFVFESNEKTKRGKYKLYGENVQITPRRKSFILTGDIKNGKFIAESLTYRYNAKDTPTGKTQRVYGTKHISIK